MGIFAMKNILRRALQPALIFAKDRIKQAIPGAVREACANHQEIQRNIVNQYLMFKHQEIKPYNNIRDAGFRVYSQFEEDGIILYILSMIGFKTRRVVEMCCGAADECMATNLILNHGFDGYLFDGNQENISAAKRFFRSKKDCIISPPVLTHAWITAENVNDLLTRNGCVGEVDLSHLIWTAMSIGFGMPSRRSILVCWSLRQIPVSPLTKASRLNIRQTLTPPGPKWALKTFIRDSPDTQRL